jgi:CheY-like chemotaxis protein
MTSPNYNKNQWLLVEDDRDDQVIFKNAYLQAGIKNELVILNNGEAALEFIRKIEKPPFVIISDIKMSGMTGLDLLKKVKEDKSTIYKSIPFLIISSSKSELEITETYKNGAQGYFEKQMTITQQVELIKSIEEYWSKCRHPSLLKESSYASSKTF